MEKIQMYLWVNGIRYSSEEHSAVRFDVYNLMHELITPRASLKVGIWPSLNIIIEIFCFVPACYLPGSAKA